MFCTMGVIWGVVVFLMNTSFLTIADQVPVVCPTQWTNIDLGCYRLFHNQLAWDNARDVCQRYGSHLLRIKDLRRNESAIAGIVSEAGTTELWMAFSNVNQPSGHHESPVIVTPGYQGHQSLPGLEAAGLGGVNVTAQPNFAQCVLVRFMADNQPVWAFAPCQRPTAFLCHRMALPDNSYQCHNGRVVEEDYVCDGENDCGDESDETDCDSLCSHHLQTSAGQILFPNRHGSFGINPRRCSWLLEVAVGHNVQIQFKELALEPGQNDELVVLDGGMTMSTSRQVARVSGQDDLTGLATRTFTSVNNFLIVSFITRASSNNCGFRADFRAVKAEGFEPQRSLTATDMSQDMFSPFYPRYLSTQDYYWMLMAQHSHHSLTLQIVAVDLKANDVVVIRDGISVYAPVLLEITSTYSGDVSYVQSSSSAMYITMTTRGPETAAGFHFRYWQGCSIELEGASGRVISPGYLIRGAQYPANQTCMYDVTVPSSQTATLRFHAVDIDPSDELIIDDSNGFLHKVSGMEMPPPIDISTGSFRVTLYSGDRGTAKGFALSYSVGCPRLPTSSFTDIVPETLVYHYGTHVTVTCAEGYAVPSVDLKQTSNKTLAVLLECLHGGVWSMDPVPTCRALCAAGWFFHELTESCEECGLGRYQPAVNATSCLRCPPGTTTVTTGRMSRSDCKTSCARGHSYSHSKESCQPCPLGTFQTKEGQFTCQPCPPFTTTLNPAATSRSLCSVDVLDPDTKIQLRDEGLIIVKLKHLHILRRQSHHRLALRQQSSSEKATALSSVLLPRTPPAALPQSKSVQQPPSAKQTWLSEELAVSDQALDKDNLHIEDKADSFDGAPQKDSDKASVQVAGETVAEGEESSPTRVLFPHLEEIGPIVERSRRQAEKEEDELMKGSGSGDDDPCNATSGEWPCSKEEVCVALSDSTYQCQCRDGFQQNITGQCVALPDSHKIYMTTQLRTAFDPDLAVHTSSAFITFHKECQETFTDLYCQVEGCKSVEVLSFRSADTGGGMGTGLVVVSALLFTVEVNSEMRSKVVETVLRVEQVGSISIGNRNFSLAGHIGLFLSLPATHQHTATNGIDWCGDSKLHQCPDGQLCQLLGLRYQCTCPASFSNVGGSCLNVAAIVGGVVGGVGVVVIVVIIVVMVVRKRRHSEYAHPERRKAGTRKDGRHSAASGYLSPGQDSSPRRGQMELRTTNAHDEISLNDVTDDSGIRLDAVGDVRDEHVPITGAYNATGNIYDSTNPYDRSSHIYNAAHVSHIPNVYDETTGGVGSTDSDTHVYQPLSHARPGYELGPTERDEGRVYVNTRSGEDNPYANTGESARADNEKYVNLKSLRSIFGRGR